MVPLFGFKGIDSSGGARRIIFRGVGPQKPFPKVLFLEPQGNPNCVAFRPESPQKVSNPWEISWVKPEGLIGGILKKLKFSSLGKIPNPATLPGLLPVSFQLLMDLGLGGPQDSGKFGVIVANLLDPLV